MLLLFVSRFRYRYEYAPLILPTAPLLGLLVSLIHTSSLPSLVKPINWNTTHSFVLRNPLLSLLERCKSLGQLKQIQAQMVLTGMFDNGFAASRLVAFCALSESRALEYCTKVLYHTPEPNVFSWNVTIRGYVESGNSEGALLLYKRMLRYGMLRPDNYTYPLLLKACCSCPSLDCVGLVILGHVLKFGFEFDIFVHNALITMLLSFGELGVAYDVFHKGCVRDLVTWNSMITGCASRGLANEAIKLYREMEAEKVKPNEITMIGIISSCSQLQDLILGREFHRYIKEHRLELTIPLNNALMDMYVKSGDLLAAQVLFDNMAQKTLVSWTTMVLGYARFGFLDVAREYLYKIPEKSVVPWNACVAISYFSKMIHIGLMPDEITFLGVLSACCHGGLVEEGRKYFSQMSSKFNISPKLKHYSCMVDLLGRAGRLEEAEELIKNMPMVADAAVWGALFFACRVHGNVLIGERKALKLLEIDPQDSGIYVLLASMYSEAKMWKEARSVRKIMKERGVEKTPGCSSVEINGIVHEFMVSDASHQQSEWIYECLGSLTKQMELL